MIWQEELGNLFGGYVNQQTLDEAAERMVVVSEDNAEYHRRFLATLDEGVAACRRGDAVALQLVNRSGYRANTIQEALDLVTGLRAAYLGRYEQAVQRTGRNE